MKLKFKLFSLVIIFCIIVSFAIVLASAKEAEVNNADNNNSLNDFYDDIEKANGTLNITKDYKYKQNDQPLIFSGDKYVINGMGIGWRAPMKKWDFLLTMKAPMAN